MWRSAQMTPTTATAIRASVNSIVMKPTTAPKINLIASTTTAAMTIHARTRLPRFPTAELVFSMVRENVLLAPKRLVSGSVVAALGVREALGARHVAAPQPQAGEAVAAHGAVGTAGARLGRHEHEPAGGG